MHVITRSCVLFLWMHTLTFVKSQDCTLESFKRSTLYDTNFDISDLETSYSSGKQVRVGCTVGYSGFFKLMCVQGTWTSKGSKCQPKSCGHPGDGQFSDFHLEMGNDFIFGSQVVYTCHKGYQMQSRTNLRRCMAAGWDGVVPICEAQQCPVIHVANNVKVTGDPEEATYGNVLRFSCKSNNEILSGANEIYCDENGEWSAKSPTCEAIKCTVPEIEHGYVPGNIQEYQEHNVLSFMCNPTHKPADARPSKCTKVGTKADFIPTPRCELITCQLPTRLQGTSYGSETRNVFLPGDTVRVTCGEEYWINSPQQTSLVTRCKDDGDWDFRPICKEVICSNPRDPLVNYWSPYYRQQFKLNEVASYDCKQGYRRTDGARRATCTRDGWRPNPLCEAQTCDREFFNDADIINEKQEYKYNERADYVCKNGYRGRFSRTCGNDGWTERKQCQAITCDTEEIENADIVSRKRTFNFNEQVEYVCKTFPGKFTRTCGENGWTGPSKCTACANVEVKHGLVAVQLNGTLYYSCPKGYKLFTKGWWGRVDCNGPVPAEPVQCIEQEKCGAMPVIANMIETHQRAVYEPGDSVDITCKEGYQAVEDRLTCHEGKWHVNGNLSTICRPIANLCSPPPKVEKAVIMNPYQKEYLSGSKVTYTCHNSSTMEGNGTIQCTDGQWDTINIKCEPIVEICSPPPGADNVNPNQTEYLSGSKITYKCPKSSTMEGNVTFQCTDGQWETINTDCASLSCDPPPADGGLTVKGLPGNEEPILPDRFLTFSCDGPGKRLNGSSRLTCGKDGQWDHPFPSCKDITCEVGVMHPPLSVFGLPPANETIKTGHTLQFQCDDPISLVGPAEIQCLQTGQWNAPFPTCSDKCQVTGVPNSVRIIRGPSDNQLRPGEKLRFACRQRGEILRGSSEVECLENAQWSDAFPTCGAPLGCERSPPLADGDTKEGFQNQYRHNDRVEYVCQRYYTMEGKPFKTCKDGKWTGQMRCLKPCTVDREAMSRHNIDFKYDVGDKLYSIHNDQIQFRCTRGSPDGVLRMTQVCVDGVMLLPTCS